MKNIRIKSVNYVESGVMKQDKVILMKKYNKK